MSPERINDPVSGFNEPKRLFNQDETDIDRSKRVVLHRINSPRPTETNVATTGRVQRQIGAIPSDVESTTKVNSTETEKVDSDILSGSFSITRAARIIHQYDVNYWAEDGVVGYVAGSNLSAPSADELDQKYNDFLAFSYVPETMVMPKALFLSMSNPQARVATVLNAMPFAGIHVSSVRKEGLTGQTETGAPETPAQIPPPFATNLQSSCAGMSYFARSSGPLYTKQRGLA